MLGVKRNQSIVECTGDDEKFLLVVGVSALARERKWVEKEMIRWLLVKPWRL